MTTHLNILKLCVGCDGVEDLLAWYRENPSPYPGGERRHVTRMWPKREAEVLGGSLYWVIKGLVLCRQKIIRLEKVEGADGILRCGIVMAPQVIRTNPAPRRPFQGWRYLPPEETPADLPQGRALDDALPPAMALALAEIGLR